MRHELEYIGTVTIHRTGISQSQHFYLMAQKTVGGSVQDWVLNGSSLFVSRVETMCFIISVLYRSKRKLSK